VEPRDGLVDIRHTFWDKDKKRSGSSVDLYFWSGVEECYGVDHVEVIYKDRVIKLTIYEGHDPAAETCIELAVRKVIRVELDEPIGNRALVDGAPKA
jgi:hypothetical protein